MHVAMPDYDIIPSAKVVMLQNLYKPERCLLAKIVLYKKRIGLLINLVHTNTIWGLKLLTIEITFLS